MGEPRCVLEVGIITLQKICKEPLRAIGNLKALFRGRAGGGTGKEGEAGKAGVSGIVLCEKEEERVRYLGGGKIQLSGRKLEGP